MSQNFNNAPLLRKAIALGATVGSVMLAGCRYETTETTTVSQAPDLLCSSDPYTLGHNKTAKLEMPSGTTVEVANLGSYIVANAGPGYKNTVGVTVSSKELPKDILGIAQPGLADDVMGVDGSIVYSVRASNTNPPSEATNVQVCSTYESELSASWEPLKKPALVHSNK